MEKLAALSERPFRLLWLARTNSAVGSAFASVALAFAVLDSGGSAASLGLVLTSGVLMRLAFLLIGGVWADRLPRKQVMLAADLLRMLTQAAIATLLLTRQVTIWELILSNALISIATAFFRPASTGLVAQSVSSSRLQEANALLSISESTASFAGPALSGLLVATAGVGWSFMIDAASFGISATFLARMPAFSGTAPEHHRFVTELADGWRELAAHRWYWLNLITHALWNVAVAVLFVLGPVIAKQRLGGAVGWGFISAGLSAGAVVGGFIALRVKPHRPLLTGNLGLTLGALPLLALAARLPLSAIVIGAAFAFAGMAFLNGIWQTAVQQLIPARLLARVSSYDNLVSYAVMPIGYALAALAAGRAGPTTTFVFAAALMLVPSAAVSFAGSVRGLVRRPDGTLIERLEPATAVGARQSVAEPAGPDQ